MKAYTSIGSRADTTSHYHWGLGCVHATSHKQTPNPTLEGFVLIKLLTSPITTHSLSILINLEFDDSDNKTNKYRPRVNALVF